jgi:hypothetical protein
VWTHYRDPEQEVVTIRGYVVVEDESSSSSSSSSGDEEHGVTVNPVQISRNYENDPQAAGTSMRSQIAAQYTGTGIPPKDQEYAQSSWERWSSQHYNQGGKETHSRVYHQIPSEGPGTEGTNFGQTEYGYDDLCRRDQETSPEDTITKQTLNPMGWLEEVEVGTSPGNLEVNSTRQPIAWPGPPIDVTQQGWLLGYEHSCLVLLRRSPRPDPPSNTAPFQQW